MTSSTASCDVLIAGAGLAGSVAAHVLAKSGLNLALIDARPRYPACFKAEKIEADQAELFREFGLMDALRPHTGQIHEVLEARNGRVLRVLRLEQYGIYYHDMVNEVRRRLPTEVDFRVARVQDVASGEDRQEVLLNDGSTIRARLVVVACGTGGGLSSRLGLRRRTIRDQHSVAFGFDVEAAGGRRFPFQSVTYYPGNCREQIGYLTLFLIRDKMRANLFAFQPLTAPWSRAVVRDPAVELKKALPQLARVTGDFRVTGKVESARINLYRLEGEPRPGLITIGDTFQSVCPTTGTGLTKVLTDVRTLCIECIPEWLATREMSVEKLRTWYEHPRKRQVDEQSLAKAEYRRQVSTDDSFRWRIHRMKVHWAMLRAGIPEALRLPGRLTV